MPQQAPLDVFHKTGTYNWEWLAMTAGVWKESEITVAGLREEMEGKYNSYYAERHRGAGGRMFGSGPEYEMPDVREYKKTVIYCAHTTHSLKRMTEIALAILQTHIYAPKLRTFLRNRETRPSKPTFQNLPGCFKECRNIKLAGSKLQILRSQPSRAFSTHHQCGRVAAQSSLSLPPRYLSN
jgi:hypothetical protein